MSEENQLAKVSIVAGSALSSSASIFFNVAKFEHAQRVAQMLSSSTMIPEHFRGKDNIGNCVIALNYAERIKADPFMVMQNMYVVHGRPGIEGKLVIALVNQCGRFEPLQFEEKNKECIAIAKELRSGKTLKGPKIDWPLVSAEGWDQPKGKMKSKWETMPQLMFRYRAATYFARTYCPEVLMGMQTVEEIKDFIDLQKGEDDIYARFEKDANAGEELDIDSEDNKSEIAPQPTEKDHEPARTQGQKPSQEIPEPTPKAPKSKGKDVTKSVTKKGTKDKESPQKDWVACPISKDGKEVKTLEYCKSRCDYYFDEECSIRFPKKGSPKLAF